MLSHRLFRLVLKQRSLIKLLIAFSLLFSVTSCGIFGLHLKDHNPRKPGKYPSFSKEIVLLGELTTPRNCYDVTFHDLDIRINAAQKSLSGWVAIEAMATSETDSIQVDLDEPLLIEDLRWGSRDGSKLFFTRQFRAVFIKLPRVNKPGEKFTVHIKYAGKPHVAKNPPWSGGTVWKKDKLKNDWLGVACESEGASVWFPCKDHMADEADSAQMKFTIPSGSLSVVSNGVLVNESVEGENKSYTWKVSYPINTYNITYYVGNFTPIKDSYQGVAGKELHITHYVLKPNEDKARTHFANVKEHIRIYEELYGAYPWYDDGFKLVESPYAGMEHQTAIAYGNGYQNDLAGGQEDYIMLHEAGHEWFGNAITVADLADV